MKSNEQPENKTPKRVSAVVRMLRAIKKHVNVFNSLSKHNTKFKGFYFLPVLGWCKYDNGENGVYFGWLNILIFIGKFNDK